MLNEVGEGVWVVVNVLLLFLLVLFGLFAQVLELKLFSLVQHLLLFEGSEMLKNVKVTILY